MDKDPATFSLRAAVLLAGALFAMLLLFAVQARAQVLIDPVVVELGARHRVATVTVSLTEKSTAPMRLQAQVLRWRQDAQGEDLTEPSSDLLVTPVIADIKPGQKQLFRIALRGPRTDTGELPYRLILEDVAEPQAPAESGPGMMINLRMRYSLPVLLAPTATATDRVRWQPCPGVQPDNGQACVRLRNEGNRHIKLLAFTLSGDGWQQETRLPKGVNVLAGAERELSVTPESGHNLPVRAVHLQTAQGTLLQAVAGND
jgi:fimbrial chaperone protein